MYISDKLLTSVLHVLPALSVKLHANGVLLPWLALYNSPLHVHLLSLLVSWNFLGMCWLVSGIWVGGGGVSQKLPADSCVGMESGGAVSSMVSGTCCDTASVLRVIVISCSRLARSGGVLGRLRCVSSSVTSVALVGSCPVTMFA